MAADDTNRFFHIFTITLAAALSLQTLSITITTFSISPNPSMSYLNSYQYIIIATLFYNMAVCMTSSQLLYFYFDIMQDLVYIMADPCVTANISSLCSCGVHAAALCSGRTAEPHWSPLVSYSRKAVHIHMYYVSTQC